MSIWSCEKSRQLLCWLYNRETWVSWKGDENLESLIFSVWNLCLRQSFDLHLFPTDTLSLSNDAFKVRCQELPRTKEQLTKIPPDGNIWKAIQSGFKAMSYYCSHRELSHKVYRPRFHQRCSKHLLFHFFFPHNIKNVSKGENKRCMGCMCCFILHSGMINLELHSYIMLQTVLVSIQNSNQWIVYHIYLGVSLWKMLWLVIIF